MSKLAITYYFDHMRLGTKLVNIKIHDSGEEAMSQLISSASGTFEYPPIFKGKQELPKKGQYSIGFGFRGLVGRYLSKEEIKLVEIYGKDGVWINYETNHLCAPESEVLNNE